MSQRNFNEWISSLKESISDYKYYTDFKKIINNVDSIKIQLNILNSLIGSENIEEEFSRLIKCYPEVLKCIPILLAIRKMEIAAVDDKGSYLYNFGTMNHSIEQYIYFMNETGIFSLLKDKKITNLVDYVTGVEVGLNSNARKNRGGHLMENLVEFYLSELSFPYFKEMTVDSIRKNWELEIPQIEEIEKSNKRFDFVVQGENGIFVFETNFYATSGSKLNETARSYKMLAQELKGIKGLTFIWITDGKGWLTAKKNLRETFENHQHVYNLKDIENGILHQIIQ